MKKLILALLLLVPLGAHAQVEPSVYRAITNAQILATDTNARSVTQQFFRTGVALFTCTAACYFHVAKTPLAATTTGAFIPANLPRLVAVRQGEKVSIILSTGTGLAIIEEVGK